MKSTTSLTIDSEVLAKAKETIPNLSEWVNRKLIEYNQAKGQLAGVKDVLMPDEAVLLEQYREDKAAAEKLKNEKAVADAEYKMSRVKEIHERLNELARMRGSIDISEMDERDAMTLVDIKDEQKALKKELGELNAE